MLSLKFGDKKVLPLNKVGIGKKAKCILSPTRVCEETSAAECFRQSVSDFKKLPFNSLIKNCAFLNPLKGNDHDSLSSISILALSICKPLKVVLPDIFNGCATEEEICDHIRTEWRLYQTVEISESCYKKDVDKYSGRKTSFVLGKRL